MIPSHIPGLGLRASLGALCSMCGLVAAWGTDEMIWGRCSSVHSPVLPLTLEQQCLRGS